MGPIDPFYLEISGHEITIRREDLLYPEDPTLKIHQVPASYRAKRGSLIPMTLDPIRIADATGITDPIAYRKKRQILLKSELEQTVDPWAKAALEKRIRELDISDPKKLQVMTLSLYNDYRFSINGSVEIFDPHGQLKTHIDAVRDWPITFWMGGWDTDALCGYAKGRLTIPTMPR
jgi:hypothetical protein